MCLVRNYTRRDGEEHGCSNTRWEGAKHCNTQKVDVVDVTE